MAGHRWVMIYTPSNVLAEAVNMPGLGERVREHGTWAGAYATALHMVDMGYVDGKPAIRAATPNHEHATGTLLSWEPVARARP